MESKGMVEERVVEKVKVNMGWVMGGEEEERKEVVEVWMDVM